VLLKVVFRVILSLPKNNDILRAKAYKIVFMGLKTSYKSGFETRRDFVRVKGADSLRFLQGMWTSDLKLAVEAAPATAASYLLSVKGRPVAPAQILCLDAAEFVIATPEGLGPKTIEALDRYIVADDVELKLETPFRVWVLIDDEDSFATARINPRVHQDTSRVFRAFALESGGWLLPRAQLASGHCEVWQPLGSPPPVFVALGDDERTLLRIEAGLAEWGRDIGEESLILEFPFADEISFHKGCYIGQEVVARGTYRGQVPRAFARFQSDAPLKEGGFIYRQEDPEKPVGKMTTVLGGRALGQVRLRDFESARFEAEGLDGARHPLLSVQLLHSKVME
jgi:folate-binding protein YgfZ